MKEAVFSIFNNIKASSLTKSFNTKFIFILICLLIYSVTFSQNLKFTEVSELSGINYSHGYQIEIDPVRYRVAAGVAVSDFNNDDYPDIYVETGDRASNLLFKNNKDGTFTECGQQLGIDLPGFLGSCPFFIDYDNDGFQDLLLGSLDSQNIVIFKNREGQNFEKINNTSLLDCSAPTYSFSGGDVDKDGLVDLFLAHWLEDNAQTHLWKNQGNGSFVNVDEVLGFYNPYNTKDFTFAGNFTDFNNDGWLDLLITSDFGTSQIWENKNGIFFDHITDTLIITDENGMGNAVGDIDNDGLLDWFVSSIYDYDGVTEGNWGSSGNRLYKNVGGNKFEDITETSGVNEGSWGWGASFGDFNNDGFLDIVHTNGWPRGSDQFYYDSLKLFINNQDGTFEEVAEQCGLIDTKQGRGISVLDYDQDGDLDIFINNYRDSPSLWRNDILPAKNFITINLKPAPGITAIGTKVFLYVKGQKQLRELRCGTNYNSQNPLQLHFGLDQNKIIDSIVVSWPDGSFQKQYNVSANQFLTINQRLVLSQINDINIYPNPFRNQLKVSFNSEGNSFTKLRILDTTGKLIAENSNYIIKDNYIYFDWNIVDKAPILSTGIYLLQVLENNQIKSTRKIIKY